MVQPSAVIYCRYWGEDVVGSGSSLSLHQLHQLAGERAALRAHSIDAVAMETNEEDGEEGLPMVTQTAAGPASAVVHQKLPDWISRAILVSADIPSDSEPLHSLPLPNVVAANLRGMGYTTFFPVQKEVLSYLISRSSSLPPRDILVSAPTGCGKTLCYVVPIVTALLDCIVRQVCTLY